MTSPMAPLSVRGDLWVSASAQWRSHPHPHVPSTSPHVGPQSHSITTKRTGGVSQPGKHSTIVTSSTIHQFFRPQEPPGSLKPVTECVLQLPLEARNQQWGYVLDRHRLIGHVSLPLPLVSLMPAPGALTIVTLVRVHFDYSGVRAQWSSHSVVYQLLGQAIANLQHRFAPERAFPLEEGSVYYLPSEVFLEPSSALRLLPRGTSPSC